MLIQDYICRAVTNPVLVASGMWEYQVLIPNDLPLPTVDDMTVILGTNVGWYADGALCADIFAVPYSVLAFFHKGSNDKAVYYIAHALLECSEILTTPCPSRTPPYLVIARTLKRQLGEIRVDLATTQA